MIVTIRRINFEKAQPGSGPSPLIDYSRECGHNSLYNGVGHVIRRTDRPPPIPPWPTMCTHMINFVFFWWILLEFLSLVITFRFIRKNGSLASFFFLFSDYSHWFGGVITKFFVILPFPNPARPFYDIWLVAGSRHFSRPRQAQCPG